MMLFLLLFCAVALAFALYTVLPQRMARHRPVELPELRFLPPDHDVALEDRLAKGLAFEQFIIDRFNREHFKFVDWRSDKSHKGRRPESNMHPDLEFRFELCDSSKVFAVECKWRAAFYNGVVNWTYPAQFDRYFAYQQKKKNIVFLAIGVGGIPASPDELFVLRLDDVRRQPLPLQEAFVRQYARVPTRRFYLHTDTMQLL